MDTLIHYLWAVALYWYFKKEKKWWLGLSGAAPDVLSFGLLMGLALFTGVQWGRGPPPMEMIPVWTSMMYNITHSLVIWGAAFGILYVVKRAWSVFLWGWLLAVAMDIPTHTREFFPTPFLWPISTWTFNGFSWGQGWFMLLNYGALFTVFFLLYKRDSGKHF